MDEKMALYIGFAIIDSSPKLYKSRIRIIANQCATPLLKGILFGALFLHMRFLDEMICVQKEEELWNCVVSHAHLLGFTPCC